MANPQPDHYTRISNELLEQVPRQKLNGTQLRIILVIWRYTYGFKRKEHEFSINFLAEAIQANRSQVDRELSALIDRNAIIVVSDIPGKSRTLKFNKDYDSWLLGCQLISGQSEKIGVRYLEDTVSAKTSTEVSANPLTKKERKKTLKKGDIPVEEKLKFHDTVFLTLKQYEQLISDYGKERVDLYIEKLDEWQTNKKPSQHKKDHNKTIRVWIKGDVAKKGEYQRQKQLSPSEREAELQQQAAEKREKGRRKEEGIDLDIDIVSEEEA